MDRKMLGLIILSLFAVQGLSAVEENLDWVADEILDNVRKDIISKGGNSETVTAFNYTYNLDFIVKIGIDVLTSDGKLGDFSTLKRISSADIIQKGDEDTQTLSGVVGLTDFSISFEEVDVKVWFLSYKGPVTLSCSTNQYKIAITTTEKFTGCVKTIDESVLEKLSGCIVNFNSESIVDKLKGYVLSAGLMLISDDVKNYIEPQVRGIIEPSIQNTDICQYFKPSQGMY